MGGERKRIVEPLCQYIWGLLESLRDTTHTNRHGHQRDRRVLMLMASKLGGEYLLQEVPHQTQS